MSEGAARTPEEIRRDIEHTRDELAETAAALVERTDVKARAHEKIDETKARFTHKVDEAKAKVTGTAGAAKEKIAPGPPTAGATGEQAADATPSGLAAGAQQAAGSVAQTVRENPLPTALVAGFAVGALIGWLVARR
jgi:ElaB/YqjD/DUF883 family membrane-anchored ribosome-binding protein